MKVLTQVLTVSVHTKDNSTMSKVITVSQEEIIRQIKLACLVPAAVEGVIAHKIIQRAAQEQGITAKLSELQQVADSLRMRKQLHNANDTWLWLQKHSLSLADFEELVYNTVISRKLAQHLFADRVESFFEQHRFNYMQVVLLELLLNDEDQATALFDLVQQGQLSFHEIAYQHLQDGQQRLNQPMPRRLIHLKPEVADAVLAAASAKLLRPIITSTGVYLIQVEKIIEPDLDSALRQEILSDLFSRWLREQMAQANTEVSLSHTTTYLGYPHISYSEYSSATGQHQTQFPLADMLGGIDVTLTRSPFQIDQVAQ